MMNNTELQEHLEKGFKEDKETKKISGEKIHYLTCAIVDIYKSCEEILAICDKSFDGKKSFEPDVVGDIRDELSHILYHINDTSYFDMIMLPYTEKGCQCNKDHQENKRRGQ